MAGDCPTPGVDSPLVKSLLGVVDCNVEGLVHTGYTTLFSPSSAFSLILTTLLTLFVAIQGYRLMLGQTQLRIGDVAVTGVKLGAILVLTTQWGTYQTVVYGFLFKGPSELATHMMAAVLPAQSVFKGDLFDALQQTFDALTAFATSYGAHSPNQISPLMGGPAFGGMALTASATLLLLASLGVILAAKIVLGLLLATGPLFIALLLFDSTRGVFEGWLRAALAFALVPLASTLLLGLGLTLLEPSLIQMAELQSQGVYTLAPVYSILMLVLVYVGVSLGALVAGGMIAGGLKLPRMRQAPPAQQLRDAPPNFIPVTDQPRSNRVAAAAASLERRDAAIFDRQRAGSDRRIEPAGGAGNASRPSRPPAAEVRLGQSPRRAAAPRRLRAGARRI